MPNGASEVSLRDRRTIYAYIGLLVFLIPFTAIWHTSASFLLKDRLHLRPEALAGFWFFATIPAYVGFFFGFIRDRWSPFGRKDQGILILASGAMVAMFVFISGAKVTVVGLLIASVTKAVLDQFVGAAQQGLTSSIGQEHFMSGRLSSLWQAAAGVPGLFVAIIGGYCAAAFAPQNTFLLTAIVALVLFLFSWWRPRAIFDDPVEREPAPKTSLGADILRLIRTPAIYPCVLLLFLWNFTPGVGTPIQFFLTDTLHGDAKDFGYFNAIFNGFFIPTYLLHGYLCTRYPLRPILWVSTCFAVPQILPLLFVHSAASALWAGVPMGLMGGFATAAYFDLLIRACPAGLQGTVMMLGASVWAFSGQLGNLAGAHLYGGPGFLGLHGFALCAWATAAVYSCQLPVLLFVPRRLTGTRDGEATAKA